jgi:hypothetical protein
MAIAMQILFVPWHGIHNLHSDFKGIFHILNPNWKPLYCSHVGLATFAPIFSGTQFAITKLLGILFLSRPVLGGGSLEDSGEGEVFASTGKSPRARTAGSRSLNSSLHIRGLQREIQSGTTGRFRATCAPRVWPDGKHRLCPQTNPSFVDEDPTP